jgi:hypothetical protein
MAGLKSLGYLIIRRQRENAGTLAALPALLTTLPAALAGAFAAALAVGLVGALAAALERG